MGKLQPKTLLNKEIKKPVLKFNPGLALIGLQTTGRWSSPSVKKKKKRVEVKIFLHDF